MMASRGMGAIMPKKMPKAKVRKRRDNTAFEMFAEGGEVWNKPRPKDLGTPKKLTAAKKAKAKAIAKAAGRPYPNAIDNIRAAAKK